MGMNILVDNNLPRLQYKGMNNTMTRESFAAEMGLDGAIARRPARLLASLRELLAQGEAARAKAPAGLVAEYDQKIALTREWIGELVGQGVA